jgi:transglutaminase-like putative cysteine protease
MRLVCFVIALFVSAPVWAEALRDREIRFTYEVSIGPIPAGKGPVHVFVPLPREDENQDLLEREIRSSIPGVVGRERAHGNGFWHGSVAESDGKPITVTVESLVRRVPVDRSGLEEANSRGLSRSQRRQHARYLGASSRVVVDDPILAPIQRELRRLANPQNPARYSRAIYDWVVDNLEYEKVGEGWGNGDTFWACSERSGNCTDFRSLFISLARSARIPARFEMGFPVPEDRAGGEIGGYHCWTQFFLAGTGWVPIDASEAFKHPERREELYGGQSADRVLFTIGRDLELGPGHESGPLNDFIYPHVELGGHLYEGPAGRSFSFEGIRGAASSGSWGR